MFLDFWATFEIQVGESWICRLKGAEDTMDCEAYEIGEESMVTRSLFWGLLMNRSL